MGSSGGGGRFSGGKVPGEGKDDDGGKVVMLV